MVLRNEHHRRTVVPCRKVVIRLRLTRQDGDISHERDGLCDHALSAVLICFDEIRDCSMTNVRSNQEDLRGIAERYVVVPEIGQKLFCLLDAVPCASAALVFVSIGVSICVFWQIHIDDGKVVVHCFFNVGLHDVSL